MGSINPLSIISKKIAQGQPAVAGQTVSWSLPVGSVTYAALTLVYKKAGTRATYTQMCTDILRVRLKANSTTLWDVSGQVLIDVMTKFYGLTFNDGDLNMLFSLPTARTPVLEGSTALGTKGLASLTLEVDISASAGASLTMTVQSLIHPREESMGWICRLTQSQVFTSAIGLNEITIPTTLGPIIGIHFKSGDFTDFQVKKDSSVICEGDITTLNNDYKRYGRVPQTGYVHWDPTMRDNIQEAIDFADAADGRFIATVAATGSFPMLMLNLFAPFGPPAATK